MKFGWINLFGGIIVILLLIPNIVYEIKTRKGRDEEIRIPKYLTALENVGRYACIILMWLPLMVWEFGFGSKAGFAAYLTANLVLIAAYYVFWACYIKRPSLKIGMALAVIPAMIFLLSGILLRHRLLVGAAVLFGIAHGKITMMTHRMREEGEMKK